MQSRNPALRNAIKQAESNGPGTTSAPPPPPTGAPVDLAAQQQMQAQLDAAMRGGSAGGQTLQLPDVIAKTAMQFGVLVIFAVAGWNFGMKYPWLWIAAAVIAMVLGLVNAFKRKVSPPLILLYAVFEGIMLGAISQFYQAAFAKPGQPLVLQAVIGTLVAFGVMLFLYSNKVIKVNGTFKKIFFVAIISYAVIGFASLISALFGMGGGWGFYGVGGLGIVLCLFGVALASFSLVMDFESISQAIAYGLPERESWRLGFGLIVTLVWLYLEILRLLAIISSNSR